MARPVYVVGVRRAALIALAALAAGCGTTRPAAPTTVTTTVAKAKPAPTGLRIGVAGPLELSVSGATGVPGRLETMPAYPLVVISSDAYSLDAAKAVARQYPTSHYAYVGGSIDRSRQPNLVGVVLRDEQAALLGGIVAGLVVREQGGSESRAAWVGPQENRLANAFAEGVHRVVPDAIVLHGWSKRTPARCKEAALATLQRGAVVVMAHGGLCAQAVASAAHEQNEAALALGDFEFPSVAASLVARDAVAGVFHGGEDIVFGASSGAIGVRRLDPLISADVALRARAAAQELASGVVPAG